MYNTVLISACLLGINCRYDGSSSPIEGLSPKSLKNVIFVPICPEQLGGLPTPRAPASFSSGDGSDVFYKRSKVINLKGEDVTESYIRGAKEALKIARLYLAKVAIMKEKSPSCGVFQVYMGDELKKGIGVTSYLLKREGIEVISSKEFNSFVDLQKFFDRFLPTHTKRF